MPDYSQGKIYKIISPSTNDVYVGSTVQPLWSRFGSHIRHYRMYQNKNHKYLKSFDIVQFSDSKIVLLEEYNCTNRNQLLAREQEWIEKMMNCINNKPASRSRADYMREFRKRKNAKDYFAKYHAQYRKTEKNKLYMEKYRLFKSEINRLGQINV